MLAGRGEPPEASEPIPIRVGIVGAGGVATRHAQVLSSLPAVGVVGVTDAVTERAEALAPEVGADVFADVTALVGDAELDALYVCTPPFARGEPELLAAERGLPVFVEKPLAADLETAEAIAARLAEAGVPTGTGYHWRHLDIVETARGLLDGRVPGLVVGRWFDKVPPPAWWIRRDGSGGQMVEQATHLIDLARHLVGEVDSVFAVGADCGRCRPDGDIDEVSAGTLTFANGAVGSLAATCVLDRKQETTLEVVSPGLSLALSESELVVDDADGPRRYQPAGDARVAVDREFVAVVRGEVPSTRAPYHEALRTHRVACALAESAAEGRAVSVAA